MSYARRMTRPDTSQSEIVDGLRKAGVSCWIIGRPCDLLTHYRGRWQVLECKPMAEPGVRVKSRAVRVRRDQAEQDEFIRIYAVPIVRSAAEAIQAVTR